MILKIAAGFIAFFIAILFFTGIASDIFSPNKTVAYSPTSPIWVKVTKSYTDFATAALTNTITIYTLNGNQMIHSVIMRQTVSFGGGTIATYTGSVGITGQNQMFINNSSLAAAPSATTFYTLPTPIVPVPFNTTSSTSITSTAISTIGNLNAATAGSVDYYLYISQLP